LFVLIAKIFVPLVYPLGQSFLLWIAASILYLCGRRRWSMVCGLAGVVVVLFFGSPLVGAWLLGTLENDFEPIPVAAYPQVDAIVVLGGVTSALIAPRLTVDVNGAFDRLLHGVRLLKAKKAPLMVLTGGVMASLSGTNVPEAERMRRLAVEMGVAEESLLLEIESRNTHENAVFTARLLRDRKLDPRILLVTSASHMSRSVAVFRAQELVVIAAPTDIRSVSRPLNPGRFIPDAGGLQQSSIALKEYVGWWVYWLKGWV